MAEAVAPAALIKLLKATEDAELLLRGEYDEEDLERALTGLLTLSRALGAKAQAGRELNQLQELLRRLVETEGKREQFLQSYLPAVQAHALFTALSNIVRTHVTDRETLARIARDLQNLMPSSKVVTSKEEGRPALPGQADGGRSSEAR